MNAKPIGWRAARTCSPASHRWCMDRHSSARWFGALGGEACRQIWGLRKALTIIYAILRLYCSGQLLPCLALHQTRYAPSLQENSSLSIDIATTARRAYTAPGHAAFLRLKQQKLHDLSIIACATGGTESIAGWYSLTPRPLRSWTNSPVQGPPLPALESAAARLAVAPSSSSSLFATWC